MGVIQNSINSVLGTAAVAAGLGKKIGADKEAAKAASGELDLKQKQELLDTEMEDYRTAEAIKSNKADLAKLSNKQVLKDLEGNKVILEQKLTPEEAAAKKDLTKKISMLRRQREIYKSHIESLKKGGKK